MEQLKHLPSKVLVGHYLSYNAAFVLGGSFLGRLFLFWRMSFHISLVTRVLDGINPRIT